MKTVFDRSSREIPVLRECDVLVVGGGPAGIGAAVGAADAGADTVIVEQYGCLGGNITLGLVEVPSWYRQEETTMPGGVSAEIERRMIGLNAARMDTMLFRPSVGYVYDTEMYKYMADCLMKDHHVETILHCAGTVPYIEDGKAAGVITESKSGRCAVLAKRVIDCTGDGDIAARAGAAYEKGVPGTATLMPGTLKFTLTDVDVRMLDRSLSADDRHPYRHGLYHRAFDLAKEAGEPLPAFTRPAMHYTACGPNEISCNVVTVDYTLDATDVLSLTRSEIGQREAVINLIEFFHRFGKDSGLGNCRLRSYAVTVGVRETRRMVSDYVLTFEDIVGCRRFEDSVGVFPTYADGEGVKVIPFTADYFQVPFRVLVAKGTRNLLAAGRCISCSRDAVPTTREMDFCMLCGQAAGAASALSVRQGVESADVDIPALQQELERQGVRVF